MTVTQDSYLANAIYEVIKDENDWIDRKTIAQTLGKAALNYYDIQVLNEMVKAGSILEEKLKIATVKTKRIYKVQGEKKHGISS